MKYYSLQFGSGDPRVYAGLNPTFLIFVRMTDGATIAPPAITQTLAGSGLYQFQWGTTQPISFLADAATTSPGSAGRYVTGQVDPADRIDEVGMTLVAIGTSNIALGTSNVALGTTAVALGTTSVASFAAVGTTLVAIGNTSISLGTTSVSWGGANSTAIGSVALNVNTIAVDVQNIGETLVSIGNTSIALGTTILAELIALGASVDLSGILALIGDPNSLIGTNLVDPNTLFGYEKRIAELLQGEEQFVKGTGAFSMYDRTGATLLNQQTVTNNASLVVKS